MASDAANRDSAVALLETGLNAGRFGRAAVLDAHQADHITDAQRDAFCVATTPRRPRPVRHRFHQGGHPAP